MAGSRGTSKLVRRFRFGRSLNGNQQNEIGFLLRTLLPQGQVVTECPLSTSDGVKAIDVAWLAPERRQEVRSVICLVRAPEICVEVLSPSNTSEEISEKIALYFESGAREVWICEHGNLQFHFSASPEVRQSSEMCPEFPPQIDV
jgi:Uma2 family endonuclease